MSLFTHQPFKTIYVVGTLIFEAARLPFWILAYIFGNRPHPKWTFRQALSVRAFTSVLECCTVVQMKTPLMLTPGEEGDRWVVVKFREEWRKLFKGPMLADADAVVPGDVGGTWYISRSVKNSNGEAVVKDGLKPGDDVSNVLVILHIHGGAYVTGDGRTQASGYFTAKLLKHTPATHVFIPQYRLSTLPVSATSNPFPAALQDCLTAYLYLLRDIKVPAEKIVLSGDSAGGNALVALLRYIAEYGSELQIPAPGKALIWSPWIDPSSAAPELVTGSANYRTDYLTPGFVTWGHTAFAGRRGTQHLKNPYVNLKMSMFKSETPMWINVGGAELLYFDGKEFAEGMRKAGNDVVFDVEEMLPHDALLIGNIIGFDVEVDRVAKRAGQWLREGRASYDIEQAVNGRVH